MKASFRMMGSVPRSAAMAGSDVAIIVPVHVFHEQGGGDDEGEQAGWGDHFNDSGECQTIPCSRNAAALPKAHALMRKPHATIS